LRPSEEIFQQKTDFKEIIFKVLRYKHYFVITVGFAVVIAFLINKYSEKKYYNRTSILINVDSKASFPRGGNDLMQGIGSFGGITNVENELFTLKSFEVIYEAIEDLNLQVSYFTEEDLLPVDFFSIKSKTELYRNSPVHVIMDQTRVQPVGVSFYVQVINDSTYKISAFGTEVPIYNYLTNNVEEYLDTLSINKILKFGETISNKHYNFSVHLRETYNKNAFANKDIFFKFNNLYHLTAIYQGKLSVATTSATSSVVIISLTDINSRKITDFLNTLTKVILEKNLDKKNKMAFSTVKFIDSRISDIADSLMFAENRLQSFRSMNQVMDISFQGQRLYERINSLENERAMIVIEQKYYQYIKEYLEKNREITDLLAPSSMAVQNPVLNDLITNLMDLSNQRMKYLQQGNEKNLYIRDLEIQINNIKNTIIENISYNLNKAEISLKDIESRVELMNTQISRLPRTERELIGMERQFKLNDAIYTFLLQKRAEAQIAQASNTPDFEIIEESKYFKSSMVSPKTALNYIIAVFLGLFFPFIFIITRDFFNNRISELKDIEHMTSVPIIGQVLNNSFKSKAVIRDYPKSPLADSFRSIRTNLRFFAKGSDKMVILITSSVSGEGKSFCSTNIASVYSLLGKKTCLIGFDLRRPALYKDFNLSNEKGVSSFLIRNAEIDEIIQKTDIENLDLIAAGPIPPNPVELIASDRTELLFKELKKRYDYIIIDSSPIGVVTDSFLLFQYTDINIFIIRHNISMKEAVTSNLKSMALKSISNLAIIVNDVKWKRNSYGYKYESVYYPTGVRKGFFARVLSSRFKK
jgi:tyrosine-protein kinase Etk/Wzc